MTALITSILGAVLPHLGDIIGVFNKKTPDSTKVDEQAEIQGEKIIDDALKYKSLRILLIVLVSAFSALYLIEAVHADMVRWNHHTFGMIGAIAAGAISGVFRVFRRL